MIADSQPAANASPKSSRTSTSAAALATLLLLSALTSCALNTSPKPGILNIYAPDVLRLKAGEQVQTVDGIYKAQTDEVWHSDKRYRQLEIDYLGKLESGK